MPSIFRKPVAINKGTYAMSITDGQNAEITMYGQIVSQQPRDWWTGEPKEGDYIVQSEFMKDLDSMSRAKSLTIRMNSLGGAVPEKGMGLEISDRENPEFFEAYRVAASSREMGMLRIELEVAGQ